MRIAERSEKTPKPKGLRTVGLFAGIGGLELGLRRAGHVAVDLCEIDPVATAVLKERFPRARLISDVQDYQKLPSGADLLTAGFPCQDLSQAGHTLGLDDGNSRSGLVGEVIRLLLSHDPKWVLLENVPFMLHLARGKSLDVLLSALEDLGFSWAYRVVNSLAFGVPQRRERVYLLASRREDPRSVILTDDYGEPAPRTWTPDLAVGFYWTEGRGGLGWAVDAIPTLKSGSTIGIPSPPAIVMPDGEVVTPGIRDAERFQGFDADWTLPANEWRAGRDRWRLVGNAVTVNVAQWIGERLLQPTPYLGIFDTPLPDGAKWPSAAYNVGEGRFYAQVSKWPIMVQRPHLHEFICKTEAKPLSRRAIAGFLARYHAGSLRKSARFLEMLAAHQTRMETLYRESAA